MDLSLDFYRGKKVLVTGHTGFKGAWLSKMLLDAGADVCGYALEPPTDPSLFDIAGLADHMDSHIGDIRDFDHLQRVFNGFKPDVVLHLAAQPIVKTGYAEPRYTYETNVMGTVNILECVRTSDCVESFLNVTTDKVYLNREREAGYTEDEPLDGYDPYSNSKSCSELVTHSYRNSFFSEEGSLPISTARAGNVIGGGDFAFARIVPDCVRAAQSGEIMVLRNPMSIRPFQHVIEPLCAYLMIAKEQVAHPELADWYNVGPDEVDCVTTVKIVDLFGEKWNTGDPDRKHPFSWTAKHVDGPHEATYLRLECSKLKAAFGWQPVWSIEEAISRVVDWTRAWIDGGDILAVMEQQVADYLAAAAEK